MESGSPRRRAGALLLVAYAVTVLVSGFAWPLGRASASVWPFNRAWWVFHREDGSFYHLRFFALLQDGSRDEVFVDPWFTWPASQSTRRYDEVSRDPATLRALAAWACQRHNRVTAPSARWRAITVTDTVWTQVRGARRAFQDVPYGDRVETEKLHDEPCPEHAP